MSFLFVDRILHLERGKKIYGVKHITADDIYLSANSEGRLYFTSSLIGESLGQLAAWAVMDACDFKKRPVAGIVARAAINRKAFVGETLLLESYIDSLDDTAVSYHSVARIGSEIVFTVDGALGPLLPMTDFIDEDEVRNQFLSIMREGDWHAKFSSHFSQLLADGSISHTSFTFDGVLHHEQTKSITAVKKINKAASYFPSHFPKKPVLPMTVLLECKLNLAKEFIKQANFPVNYKIRQMTRIKMSDFVLPGDELICYLTVKQQTPNELILSFRSEVFGKRVCVMELLCSI